MSKRLIRYAMVAGVAAVAGLAGPQIINPAAAPSAEARPFANQRGETIADITAKVLPSVVSIATKTTATATPGSMRVPEGFEHFFRQMPRNQMRRGIGSGVIVSNKGYILTNNHVVDGAEEITVRLSDGRTASAKVIGTDPKSDLAVVKLEKSLRNLQPLPIGQSGNLRLGEVVLAVGNPMGVGQSVTMGIVSAKGRGGMGIVDYEDFIQTDAAINPGNSGGALVNMNGELVGVNTAILSRTGGYQGIGFAIPTDMARPIMRSLIDNGKVTRGFLGVYMQQLDDKLIAALKLRVPGRSGVLISDVTPGSPAERAGLRRNDVVVGLDGSPVTRANQFRNRIAGAGYGQVVQLEVIRDGKRVQFPVKLGKLPEDRGLVAKRSANDGESDDTFGVRIAPLDRRSRQAYDIDSSVRSGVVVTAVQPGSQAAEMGLREGDVILEVNRRRVQSAQQFKRAYQSSGSSVAVLMNRNGASQYLVLSK